MALQDERTPELLGSTPHVDEPSAGGGLRGFSQHPDISCLMLTSFADDEAVYAAIKAGTSGYVLKQVRGTDLVDASARAHAGRQ